MYNFESNTAEYFTLLINAYKTFGPITAILSTFTESFLPFLPLSGFVMANSAAFGFVQGLILSWIGSCLGALSIYAISRQFGSSPILQSILNRNELHSCQRFFEKHEALFITILCAIPIFPRFLVAIVAGVRKTNFKTFALSSSFGTFIFFTILSVVGNDLHSIIAHPLKLMTLCLAFVVLGIVGKIGTRFFA